jgi:hypothetical protein
LLFLFSPNHLAAIHGVLDKKLRSFHEKYGEVVRFSPEMVSFITGQAWKDIYGYGHEQLPKRIFSMTDQPSDIIISDDADHTHFRKHCLAPYLKGV